MHLKNALIRKVAGLAEEAEARRRALAAKDLSARKKPVPPRGPMMVNGKPAPMLSNSREITTGGTVDPSVGTQPVTTAELSPVRTGSVNTSTPRGGLVSRNWSDRQRRTR